MDTASLVELLDTAEGYGITTIKQLKVFMMHCDSEPMSVSEKTGLHDSTDPEYKVHFDIVRKLTNTGYRSDGLNLLKITNTHQKGKVYKISLTQKGRNLANKIHRIIRSSYDTAL